MKCSGCGRTLEVGDEYIKFTFSEWAKREGGGFDGIEGLDDLTAQMMGDSGFGSYIVYCTESCTEKDGDWLPDTVYGDER